MKKLYKLLLVSGTSLLILSACGKNNTDGKRFHAPKSPLATAFDTSGISLQKYNKLQYTDRYLHGGNTKKEAIKVLGTPSRMVDTSLSNNKQAKQYVWNMDNNAQVKYVFAIIYKDKVLSKGYDQNTKSKIVSKNKVDKLKNGTTFQEVQKQFGAPLEEQVSDGFQFMTYQVDSSGRAYNLTFNSQKLTKKSMTKLNNN